MISGEGTNRLGTLLLAMPRQMEIVRCVARGLDAPAPRLVQGRPGAPRLALDCDQTLPMSASECGMRR
jgi:hypothetical protein